jgi:asparagine synthase (glutamine-hydrolysing)
MCGINGVFSYDTSAPPVEEHELLATRDSMAARGPDGAGAWISGDGRVGLGHRRLAIIDLSPLGAQPMATPDGRLHVTFNGEIYNYRALRMALVERGCQILSHSDTEVLLHLYRQQGPAMVESLRGMFAFAIWDAEAQGMLLARDPYGIKPLYYADTGGQLRFASQVRALRASPAVPGVIDPGGVAGFLLWGSVPEPITVWRSIRAVPAGATLWTDSNGVRPPRRYWDLGDAIARSTDRAGDIPLGAEVEYLREALRDSVRHHLEADVPVGAFLSAGLDSSTVVGLAAEMGHGSIDTVTLAFEEFRGRAMDELPTATQIARHLGVRHSAIVARLEDIPGEMRRFLAAMDQPTVDGVNTWFVSRATASVGLKVALSGLGGDELLGGYQTFRDVPALVRRWGWVGDHPGLGRMLRRGLAVLLRGSRDPRRAALPELAHSYPGAYQVVRGLFMPWELSDILDPDAARAGLTRLAEDAAWPGADPGNGRLSPLGRIVRLESERYMRNQLLRDTDWTSMAHSLEVRVPLVDRRLTEAVVGLAAAGRLGSGKTLLPLMLARGLPEAAMTRPKTGFTVPVWRWLHQLSELDAWKGHRLLRRANTDPLRRWAYCVLREYPETVNLLARTAAS